MQRWSSNGPSGWVTGGRMRSGFVSPLRRAGAA
jgi:hypothetical protein